MRTTTAFFAGAGTVVIAIAAGLGGGMVIASMVSPHQPRPATEMAKVERRTTETVATSNAPAEPVAYLAAIQAAATNPVVVSPAPQKPQPAAQNDTQNNATAAAAAPSGPERDSSAQPGMNAQPSAPSAARAASVASNDALARARDADPRREARRAEDRRKAERRQQWAERRRREPREDELRDVERSVREDTERPRVLQAEPVSVETPIIRLFGNED
jgi:hypothetical protein